jgi:hypothetical protein
MTTSGPYDPTGASGRTGTSGPYGATGTSGPTGTSGSYHATGTSGPTGTSGSYDATGTSGPTGTSGSYDTTGTSGPVAYRDDERRHARETKPSFKTTELIVYLLSVIGVLIASWVVDVREDGQGFSAYQGWFLVTLLTIGYLISRGLAKSGSRDETR